MKRNTPFHENLTLVPLEASNLPYPLYLLRDTSKSLVIVLLPVRILLHFLNIASNGTKKVSYQMNGYMETSLLDSTSMLQHDLIV
mmetsp:Transcript_8983/g.30322  ORF Transcript_8983/g.30322 Transcript_8983/m.30322 type:complete len:85 (-) Transcript_8983:1451-1705(-)